MNTSNVSWHEAAPSIWIGEAAGFHESTDPTVTILGGVHGDEQTGIAVVNQSLESLNLDRGRVILGLGNLAGIKAKKRYLTHNLNRQFIELGPDQDPTELSEEQQRAQALMEYMRLSGASLDLHDFTNKKNSPFLITNDVEIAKTIGAPIISTGWEIDKGGSDEFMNTLGRTGLCYEVGQKDSLSENLDRGHGAVARFLVARGVQEGNWQPLFDNPIFIHNDRAYYYKGGEYQLLIPADTVNFSDIEAGTPLAHINGEEVVAGNDQVIIFPTAPKDTKIGDEAFYVGHKYAA